jgi:hypothetical protein
MCSVQLRWNSDRTRRRRIGVKVLVIVLALLVAACSSGSHHAAARPTTVPSTVPTTTPGTAAGFTPEQLDAHLGVGVPRGWDPVDGGNARLWVPNTWTFGLGETCVDTAYDLVATAPTYSRVTDNAVPGIPRDHCKATPQIPPDLQAVAFFPDTPSVAKPGPALKVHGYRIYRTHTPTRTNPWTFYVIPQLDIQIATIGPLAERILNTLAPSNREIADTPTFQTPPARWHTVTANGVTLSVPSTWNITSSSGPTTAPTTTDPTDANPTLTILKPFNFSTVTGVIGPQCCPPPPPPSTPEIRGLVPPDGATLYLDATDDGTTESYDQQQSGFATTPGQPLATLHHDNTTIRVWSEHWTPDTLDLFFSHDGSTTTHALVLSLGRDGRTAGMIIGSIRAVT